MQDYSSFLPLIKQAALQAGKDILKIYESEDFAIEIKSDDTPLTRADIAAHKIILEHLKNTDFPVLSEEGKTIPYQERENWETLWIVDPIDGTKEFIKKNDEFTVNIALVHKNKPVLGLVYAPALQKLYFGGPEIGAFLETQNQSSKKLKSVDHISEPIRIATSRSHLSQKTKDFISSFDGETKTIPVGSSLKFMLLAENKIDLYPKFGPCMEWDTAAAHAILKGLDIEVINMENQQPLAYNKEDLYNPNFLVKRDENIRVNIPMD